MGEPVSYTAPVGLVTTVVALMSAALVLLGLTAVAVLVLRRRMDEISRRESQTTAAVDRLTHMISAPEDQRWFWTPEWQAGERQADEDIAAGRTTGPMTGDEFVAHLDRLDAEATAEERDAGRVAA